MSIFNIKTKLQIPIKTAGGGGGNTAGTGNTSMGRYAAGKATGKAKVNFRSTQGEPPPPFRSRASTSARGQRGGCGVANTGVGVWPKW